jgi:hypothetical protein
MSEHTGDRLPQLLEIARLIAREPDTASLVERILVTAKDATGADGGSVHLVEDDHCTLIFALVINDTLGLRLGGASGRPVGMQAPALYDRDGTPNHSAVVTHCALGRESIRLDDAYLAAATRARTGIRGRAPRARRRQGLPARSDPRADVAAGAHDRHR